MFRYLTFLAPGYRLAINHLDVVTAFLNPHVDNPELYIEIHNGWDNCDGDCDCGDCDCGDCEGGDCACGNGIMVEPIEWLNKALYGLKQAP